MRRLLWVWLGFNLDKALLIAGVWASKPVGNDRHSEEAVGRRNRAQEGWGYPP